MKKINKNTIQVKVFPGLATWLAYQKDADGLICKLLIDYRFQGKGKAEIEHLIKRYCD